MTKDELIGIIREAIRPVIAEEVRKALTAEITIEKIKDDRTGQPLAVVERKTESVFLPSLMVQMLPYHEGAFRGFQQDLTRTKKALDNANVFIKRLADAVETQANIKAIEAECKPLLIETSS
jgi:hypothetical protein